MNSTQTYPVDMFETVINDLESIWGKPPVPMNAVSDTLAKTAKYPRRCCKRSNYIAIQKAVQYLKQ